MKKMNNRLCQSACLSVCRSNYFLGSGSEGDEEHGICLYICLSIPPPPQEFVSSDSNSA